MAVRNIPQKILLHRGSHGDPGGYSVGAKRVFKIKIPKGTAYVEGGVASQVGKPGFGAYATGNGKQFYFLDEGKLLFQVMEDIPNPLGY